MASSAGIYSRPEKLNDAQTVLYEIDMLQYAYDRLASPPPTWTQPDQWVYLEDFLLHYRNLIQFFGKLNNLDNADLSITRPEAIWDSQLPPKSELDVMTDEGLWKKYDTWKNPEAISKYLHHCTTHRTTAKEWKVKVMYDELRPLIEKFECLLPQYKPVAEFPHARSVAVSTLEGNSTTSTRTFDSLLNN